MRFTRLWPWRRSSTTVSGQTSDNPESQSPLEQAGQLLRQSREQRGLSMRDLSREIRITTPVLEALERGWSDRLPEAAYLGTMLTRLERHLELPPESLIGALPAPKTSRNAQQSAGNRRFTIGSIDILSTWQGSVVYGVVMVGTLMALNQQQRYLAQRNSHQLQPIAPTADDLDLNNQRQGLAATLPGLRPLEDSQRRPLVQWLPPASQQEAASQKDGQELGLLQLTLSRPSAIEINSEGGDRTALKGSQGTLTLQLLAPITLTVSPPLEDGDQVLWNGQPQPPVEGKPGSYRLPQTDPRSP